MTEAEFGETLKKSKLEAFQTFFESPSSSQSLGIDWAKKQIVGVPLVHWADVIHEMGHLFASFEDPEHSDEMKFFGWEFLLAKQVGDPRVWIKKNDDYGLGNGYGLEEFEEQDFGALNSKEKRKILKKAIAVSKEARIVDHKENLLKVDRTLKTQEIVTTLSNKLKFHESRAEEVAACEHGNRDGRWFESKTEEKGFAAGYKRAVEDVHRVLYNSMNPRPSQDS